jgi:MOSC domain-containing protein YiiM
MVDPLNYLTYTHRVRGEKVLNMPEVVQVSVGTPTRLGTYRNREVISSIRKSDVGTNLVTVTPDGIEGDEQADKRVVRGKRIHGGQFQAVYAYPLDHLGLWAAELGISDRPGTFGENLTVAGLTERDVRSGDLFRWGDVELRVAKPRRPCYKLPMHLGVPDVALQMNRNGRSGWYFEVVTPGTVRTDAGLELVSSNPNGLTVAFAFAAKVRADPTIPDD